MLPKYCSRDKGEGKSGKGSKDGKSALWVSIWIGLGILSAKPSMAKFSLGQREKYREPASAVMGSAGAIDDASVGQHYHCRRFFCRSDIMLLFRLMAEVR